MSKIEVHDYVSSLAMDSGPTGALRWIHLLAPLAELLIGREGKRRLHALDLALKRESGGAAGVRLSGSKLLEIRRRLARGGFGALDVPIELGGSGMSPAVQCLAQFICGYYDVDLRDATGPGHGRMILLRGSSEQLANWRQAILSGALVGVAVTERAGGSSLLNIKSELRPAGDGWLLSGEKTWISRVEEADALVVFARVAGDGHLAAIIVEPQQRGFEHSRVEPVGLKGWSWGRIRFDDVRVEALDMLAVGDEALSLFHEHFTYYRPLAAATAVGGAAAMLDYAADRIARKDAALRRDVAHSAVATHSAALEAALLLLINTISTPDPKLGWARSGGAKAYATEAALAAVNNLAPLLGAESFVADGFVDKLSGDLKAFQFADGANDALLRYAGRKYLESYLPTPVRERPAANSTDVERAL
jgi:alkylation response protein AidB-like acyl-CoA dehydrogenase